MSGGVFAVARNIFEHEFFEDEPFTEREAWIWLIREAAWKERVVRVGKTRIPISRGQCTASVRFMADRWRWSKSRVNRFLHRLQAENMVKLEAGQQRDSSGTAGLKTQGIITVCNYDDYQRVSLPGADITEAAAGQEAGQQRDSSGTNKNTGRNTLEEISLTGPAALPAKSLDAEVYRVGKELLGKSAGGVITKLRKACEYDDAYALDWLRQAAEKQSPIEWINGVLKATDLRAYRNVAGADQSGPPAIDSKEDREYRAWEDRYYATVL